MAFTFLGEFIDYQESHQGRKGYIYYREQHNFILIHKMDKIKDSDKEFVFESKKYFN